MSDRARDPLIADWVERVPEIDPLTEGVVERVHLISRYFESTCRQLAAPYGINTGDYDILARLYWTGEPHRLTPTQLAAGTQTATTTITGRLDRLERLGLTRRVPVPEDRRSLHVELTEDGSRLFHGIVVQQARLERTVLHRLPTSDLTALRDLLDDAMTACQEQLGPPARRVDLVRKAPPRQATR